MKDEQQICRQKWQLSDILTEGSDPTHFDNPNFQCKGHRPTEKAEW